MRQHILEATVTVLCCVLGSEFSTSLGGPACRPQCQGTKRRCSLRMNTPLTLPPGPPARFIRAPQAAVCRRPSWWKRSMACRAARQPSHTHKMTHMQVTQKGYVQHNFVKPRGVQVVTGGSGSGDVCVRLVVLPGTPWAGGNWTAQPPRRQAPRSRSTAAGRRRAGRQRC